MINVGRFESQKNQITILKAVEILKNIKKFNIKLYGYGKKFEFLKNFVKDKKLKNVKLINKVFDDDTIYKNADLYVGSSLYEGFPNTLC